MTITTQQKELVKDVARKLSYAIDNRGSRPYVADLIREETKQERQHRNGWCAGRDYPRNFGPKLAAEFFTVHHILGFVFDGVPFPKIEDVLSLRGTYVQAAAIAAQYIDAIFETIPAHQAKQIRALDYVQLCDTGSADE
jgi:hypothetical protein